MKMLSLTLLLIGMMRSDASAQGGGGLPKFTREEFYQALRPLMGEAEARETAKQFSLPPTAGFDELGIPPEARPTSGGPSPMIGNISDDMLLLLALVSEETHQKVDRFRRAARDGAPFTADEERSWNQRLAQLRKWKEAGYPMGP